MREYQNRARFGVRVVDPTGAKHFGSDKHLFLTGALQDDAAERPSYDPKIQRLNKWRIN